MSGWNRVHGTGPELRELERAILNQDSQLGGPAAGAGVAALPARTTTLFGREGDLDALAGLIKRARMVTLTGPGGGQDISGA